MEEHIFDEEGMCTKCGRYQFDPGALIGTCDFYKWKEVSKEEWNA